MSIVSIWKETGRSLGVIVEVTVVLGIGLGAAAVHYLKRLWLAADRWMYH